MTLLDQIALLLTGLVALYLVVRFFNDYRQHQGTHNVFYMISFLVLLVAGLLLIAFTYDILGSPWVVIVSALIPICLSLGLVYEFYPNYGKLYLVVAIIGLIAMGVTRFTGPPTLATIFLIIVHSIAGILIILTPILAARQGLTSGGFIGVSIGGILIGLGGVALAFLKLGKQFLFFSQEFVFTILAPLLLLMVLCFAWGFMKKVKVPGSSTPQMRTA
ncbi:MAG TPA: hypothetical protein ENK60_02455 [Anaerolineae bacterium]|nr:hypothetical protein [Anaerolineae bacterium]